MTEILKCDHYSNRLLIGLRTLQENHTLCDLTLMAEDQAVHVHRAVMAASSDYFRALLTLDMREKGQDIITLRGVPANGLRHIVQFAYSGHLHCSLENIPDILIAATHLQLTEAIHLCGKYLEGLTNDANCVDMYNLGEQFNLVPVKDKALDLVLSHFEEIANKDDFNKLNKNFLAKILADNRLRVFSELRLFELVLKWISYHVEDRKAFTYDLMSKVRFPLIPPPDLVDFVMNEPIMKSDPQCLDLILEANKYHMLPEKQAVMQNSRTLVRTDRYSLVMLDIDDDGPRVLDLGTNNWGTLRYCSLDTFHAQVCVLNNYMYVCGGIELYSSNNPVSGKCCRYDPRFDMWNEITPMQEPRHHFSLVSNNKTLFALGGYCSGNYIGVVEQYIVGEDKWVYCTAMEVKLSATAAAESDGKIYISGGQSDKGISRCMWCYTIGTDSWSGKSPMLQPRMDHAMCCYGNKLYLLGGYDKNIVKAYDIDTVEAYDIKTDQWMVIRENTPKISGIYSTVVGSKVFVVGGFSYDDNKKRNEVLCYDIMSNEWETIAKIHAPAMSVPCCALFLPRNMLRDITV